ncbi:hypothetical protein KDH_36890 [Dictyobacter sp. S3.2.2.5]|uniref:Uncharacterized protein n=1 Tax=Dictyobacter halimunensis TaxID=3026934 RepID=A0ABQ6FUA2_9CHLR|nr:hypothetical protein KDH_36890 [Dictyobacter sp. S3.2.2.5]
MSKEIGETATEQQEPPITDDVRFEDPLQIFLCEVQGVLDGWKRDPDNGCIKNDEKLGCTEQEEGSPTTRVCRIRYCDTRPLTVGILLAILFPYPHAGGMG